MYPTGSHYPPVLAAPVATTERVPTANAAFIGRRSRQKCRLLAERHKQRSRSNAERPTERTGRVGTVGGGIRTGWRRGVGLKKNQTTVRNGDVDVDETLDAGNT